MNNRYFRIIWIKVVISGYKSGFDTLYQKEKTMQIYHSYSFGYGTVGYGTYSFGYGKVIGKLSGIIVVAFFLKIY